MVSIENNSSHEFSETDEKPDETEMKLFIDNYNSRVKGHQIIKTEEPLIETNEEPGGRDPLLIDETFEPLSNIVRNVWKSAPRTYSRKKTNNKNKIQIRPQLTNKNKVKMRPQLPLEDLVVQAIETIANPRGSTLQRIKNFLLSKYDPAFKTPEVNKAVQKGIENGLIKVVKRVKKRRTRDRYTLCKFGNLRAKSKIIVAQGLKSLAEPTSFNTREANVDENNSRVSTFNDNLTESIVDSKLSVLQEDMEIKFNTNNNKNDLSLEPTAQKICDPIHKDEIDFMVLHSTCFAPHPKGIRLYEIADFIDNYYDIDTQSSLPYIEKYLKYGVEERILYRSGDRYRRTAAMWKLNSKLCSLEQVKYAKVGWPTEGSVAAENKSENDQLQNVFFCADVKVELEETGDTCNTELVSGDEKIEINTNNNTIRSTDEKQEATCTEEQKYHVKRKNFSSINNVPSSKKARIESPQNILEERKTHADNTDVELAQCIKVEEPLIKLEEGETIEDPFALIIHRKVLPFSFENIRTKRRQSARVTVKPKAPKKGKKTRWCQVRSSKKKLDFQGDFDEPYYTLPEMNDYMSRNPKILLNNPVAVMWDLSWEKIGLANNLPCLKLTGFSISSDDNSYCTACDAELRFGLLHCDACSWGQGTVMEKCNICGLLCNRRDVFRKHFDWEHIPLIQGIDDFSVSVSEKNIEKLLNVREGDNFICCRICKSLTKSIEMFESHMLIKHASKMNVLPPLPKVEDWDEVVIFRNEITDVCCLKCNECGFISNRNDFMLYHILDVHEFEVGNGQNQNSWSSNTNVEPLKTDEPGKKVKWSFGLCHICGKLYNNILTHLKRYRRTSDTAEFDIYANVSPENEALVDAIESLPLSERIIRRPRRPKKKRNRNGNTLHLCHICGKLLKHRIGEHMRVHDPRLWGCEVCGRQFNRQSNLVTHKRVHTREKPFQCDICKMTFGYKCSIKGHIINVHSETVT